jgi:2-hydroxychromene-2-carboxylate isomerase
MRWRVEENTDALAKIGHWGVPVLVLDGELYWGQDRIDELETALLERREAGRARQPVH